MADGIEVLMMIIGVVALISGIYLVTQGQSLLWAGILIIAGTLISFFYALNIFGFFDITVKG